MSGGFRSPPFPSWSCFFSFPSRGRSGICCRRCVSCSIPGAGLRRLKRPWRSFFVAAIWPSRPPRPRRRARRLRRAFPRRLPSTPATAFFQVCYPEDTVASMLVDYRAGAGFEGMYEYEPPGGDDSSIATGLPDACLVSDPTVVLGKPDPDDPDANPVWNPDQGSCQATFAAAPRQSDQPRAPRDSRRNPLMPAILSCASSAIPRGAFASTARIDRRRLPQARRRPHRRARPARPSRPDRGLDHHARRPRRPLAQRPQRAPAHRPVFGLNYAAAASRLT